MNLDPVYRNALIIDGVILGCLIVGGFIINVLLNIYCKRDSCMFIGYNVDNDRHRLAENGPQVSTRVDMENAGIFGEDNGGFRSAEGATGLHQAAGGDSANNNKTAIPAAKEPSERGLIISDDELQVVVEIDATTTNRSAEQGELSTEGATDLQFVGSDSVSNETAIPAEIAVKDACELWTYFSRSSSSRC